MECSKCSNTSAFTAEPSTFYGFMRDATDFLVKCSECPHEWVQRKYWMRRVDSDWDNVTFKEGN